MSIFTVYEINQIFRKFLRKYNSEWILNLIEEFNLLAFSEVDNLNVLRRSILNYVDRIGWSRRHRSLLRLCLDVKDPKLIRDILKDASSCASQFVINDSIGLFLIDEDAVRDLWPFRTNRDVFMFVSKQTIAVSPLQYLQERQAVRDERQEEDQEDVFQVEFLKTD